MNGHEAWEWLWGHRAMQEQRDCRRNCWILFGSRAGNAAAHPVAFLPSVHRDLSQSTTHTHQQTKDSVKEQIHRTRSAQAALTLQMKNLRLAEVT